jgi:hypothetical protein
MISENIRQLILSSCRFSNGELMLDCTASERREIYDLFRVSILDGLIPISKVVGLKHTSSYNYSDVSAIDRHRACKENMMELARNVSKLIFVSDIGVSVDTEETIGKIYANNAGFTSNSRLVEVLDGNIYLYTSIDYIGLRLFVLKQAGYNLLEDNVKKMRMELSRSYEYFPINSEHVLLDYVRVLPMFGDKIRYRLINNISEKHIEKLWLDYIKSGGKQ